MRCALLFGALSLLVSGCSRGPSVPDDTLVDILVELQLIDAAAEMSANPDSARAAMETQLYAAYGVEAADIHEALAYHARRPDDLVAFYDRVIDSLSVEALFVPPADTTTALPFNVQP